MDQISSHNNYRLSEAYQRPAQFPTQHNPATEASSKPSQVNESQSSDFASLFNDDSLMKLQGNLEAIAQMAERSLKHIDS